jgi:hypothetical protein
VTVAAARSRSTPQSDDGQTILGPIPASSSGPCELHVWSGWRDSNPRPPAPKAGALTKLRYIPCAAPVPGRRHDLRPTRASLRESAEPVGSPLLVRLEAGQGVRRVNGEHLADLAADWPMPMVRTACGRSDAARAADDQQAAVPRAGTPPSAGHSLARWPGAGTLTMAAASRA